MKHEEANDLLSWYATGTLDATESEAVEAHVVDCTRCGAELAELRFLHVAVAEDGAEEPAFRPELIQNALAQIDREARDERSSDGVLAPLAGWFNTFAARFAWSGTPAFARYALVGQLALVVGLAAVLVLRQPVEQEYGTLSGGAPQTDQIVRYSLVFAPEVREGDLRLLLQEVEAELVAGPSSLGVYTIGVRAEVDQETVLARLRDSELIAFVEPVPKR
jgi:hypothetical protein